MASPICDEAVSICRQKRSPKYEDSELAATFGRISSVYGEENTLKMVKKVPMILEYKTPDFKPTYDAFVGVFGEEETKALLARNPLLLSVRPTGYGGADTSGKETIFLSYVIDITRPLGPVLLAGLFFALSVPAIEIATGIPREQFFQSITGGN
eukprot:CAMPEP_0113941410 /NCGR_PEP_ID=MMETSP1339-20121228/7323_1 /TAXON_ID=94617 /ORGANISM="Fibrocapsa japonica" /LENGTH=153 /DNA_ID=CAMNT_0000945541 /DNA_START=185 /DNA_END=646 /DNA_ORIENTATION=+ /assembly_acc=CAM_ASM_000762